MASRKKGTRNTSTTPASGVDVHAEYVHSADDPPAPGTFDASVTGEFADLVRSRIEGPTNIRFGTPTVGNPQAEALWQAVRAHTDRMSFPAFDAFVQKALTPQNGGDTEVSAERLGRARRRIFRPQQDCAPFGGFIPGLDAYAALKLAAEIFLLLRCGICPPIEEGETGTPVGWWTEDVFGTEGDTDPDVLLEPLTTFLGSDRRSYIRSIIANVFRDQGLNDGSFVFSPFSPVAIGFGPCLLELIWSYWHEQGMQAQTMNAIALRFQNVRLGEGRDPLAELEIDPLRPLSGFLWGYIQDEPHRLTVARRAYEYSHHYGLSLVGRAVGKLRPADPRSKFLRSFHDLLRTTDLFFREAADNTVTPDPFPLLIALRDLHMILSEGAHNQFRDLPWTARLEMLVEQWILARPEMRDFLRGRLMVPYAEPWMGAVDAMKRLQGWTDTNITHFHDLAVFGERLLLSVRYIAWNTINDPNAAADWATFWRPEIQGYIHGYRSATGVSLSDDVLEVSRAGDARYLQPSFHLRNRLQEQRPGGALPAAGASGRAPLAALPRPDARKR